jgi:hypothetical protein
MTSQPNAFPLLERTSAVTRLLSRAFAESDTSSTVALTHVLEDMLCRGMDVLSLDVVIEEVKDIVQMCQDRDLIRLMGDAVQMRSVVEQEDREEKEDDIPGVLLTPWGVDQIVDCLDKEGNWCVSRVLAVKSGVNPWYYVHFEEWKTIHNEWVHEHQIREFDGRPYAPQSVWKCAQKQPKWQTGDIIGAKDLENNWWLSRVLDVYQDPTYPRPWYYVHFEGWPSRYDEWISSEMRVKSFYPRRDNLLSRVRGRHMTTKND